MGNPEQAEIKPKGISSHALNWLVVAVSAAGVVLGLLVLLSTGASSMGPAVINLGIAVMALAVALLIALRKQSHWSVALVVLAVVIAIVCTCASLLHRDDYFGGSCGQFDWPSGHLHAGYPYSWLDGNICVPPGEQLAEYVRQNPRQAAWYPDLPVLIVDLSFWMNTGILAGSILGLVKKRNEMK